MFGISTLTVADLVVCGLGTVGVTIACISIHKAQVAEKKAIKKAKSEKAREITHLMYIDSLKNNK